MAAIYVPTDSILRRHFNQIAATAGLPPLPEDSVLRRHHAQLMESRLAAPRPATPVVMSTTITAAPTHAPERPQQPEPRPSMAQVHASPVQTESKSWLGKVLDKLFG